MPPGALGACLQSAGELGGANDVKSLPYASTTRCILVLEDSLCRDRYILYISDRVHRLHIYRLETRFAPRSSLPKGWLQRYRSHTSSATSLKAICSPIRASPRNMCEPFHLISPLLRTRLTSTSSPYCHESPKFQSPKFQNTRVMSRCPNDHATLAPH